MSIEQSRYQIRFDWGVSGCHAVGTDADVIVWVDAIAGEPIGLADLPAGAAIVAGSFPVARAVADWVATLQKHLGRRIIIAIVAAGESRTDGGIRFAVEDQLAAGAVIDRLAAIGLDATSPEAAAAEGAFLHLDRAVGHLVTASVSATAAADPLSPGMFRINDELAREDVLVLRHHAEA